ncbi:MAG TPA: hypothetical protein VGO58_11580 [Chitinophagaceae bacterium]|jgi:hypothetical protein|nr:hypothetical protein [Chitinophagaceae bacterium]
MKKTALVLLLSVALFSCKKKKNTPKVDDIQVNIQLERFDRDFFALDTNNLLAGLTELNKKHPGLTSIFLRDILGLDSALMLTGVKNFLHLSGGLYDTVNTVFKNTTGIERDFKKSFQYLRYYFPAYPLPAIATIAGPMDAMATSDNGPTPDFLRPGLLGISLQFYLGKNFSVYSDPFFTENVAPGYRSRRFSKEYIIADAMQLIINDMFPDKSGAKPLIEQMVEKGKRWYLMDLLLPTTPDSVKTGYTQLQLDWCNANEGLIWADIVKGEDLYSLSPATIQTYIGEAPFTQGFSQEYSPGNIGQWIGSQIVKKFMSKNPDMKPEELMNTPASKILDEAKYKPK